MDKILTALSMTTALAAVFVPMITTYITDRGNTKRKALELIFCEKFSAYKEFLDHSGRFFNDPLNTTALNDLRGSLDRACLLSSPETYRAVSVFVGLLFDIQPPAYTSEQMEEISKAHADVVRALRIELEEYDVFKGRFRRLKLRVRRLVRRCNHS